MKTQMRKYFSTLAAVALIGGSTGSMAASGTMHVKNKSDGDLNVVVTHFGCAGVHDGVATACTELPHGHKGYIDNIKPGDTKTITFKDIGMSTGYVVWGIDTRNNSRYGCGAGVNTKMEFYNTEHGKKLTCKHY